MKRFILSAIALICTALTIMAQDLNLIVPDKDLQAKCTLVGLERRADGNINIIRPSFHGDTFAYDEPLGEGIKKYFIVFDQDYFVVFLKEGETLQVTATPQPSGKPKISYKGLMAAGCVMNDSLRSYYSYPKYFSLTGDRSVALENNVEKCKNLDKYYALLQKAAKKVKPQEFREQLEFSNRCEYLRYRINLLSSRLRHEGQDVTQNKEFQDFLSWIDVNDPRYESYSLVSSYIKGKCKTGMDEDVIQWGFEFLDATNKYLSEPQIKRDLQNQCALLVFQSATLAEKEAFVKRFEEIGDQTLAQSLRIQLESAKNTEEGMDAPDNEFEDKAGNKHRFSDYKGKYLYVDFWATWCGPCKAEIPHLASLVDKYKDNDKIAFISISMDANRSAWEKMIAKDNPAWPQFIFNEAQSARASKDWGISGIPRFIMISPNGKVYSSDALRPSDPNLSKIIDSL